MPAIITTRYNQLQRMEEARDATMAHLSASQGVRAHVPAPPVPALHASDASGARRRMRRFGEPFNAANANHATNAGVSAL